MRTFVKELKAHLAKTSADDLAKTWEELSVFNEVGPTVDTFMQGMEEHAYRSNENLSNRASFPHTSKKPTTVVAQ